MHNSCESSLMKTKGYMGAFSIIRNMSHLVLFNGIYSLMSEIAQQMDNKNNDISKTMF